MQTYKKILTKKDIIEIFNKEAALEEEETGTPFKNNWLFTVINNNIRKVYRDGKVEAAFEDDLLEDIDSQAKL